MELRFVLRFGVVELCTRVCSKPRARNWESKLDIEGVNPVLYVWYMTELWNKSTMIMGYAGRSIMDLSRRQRTRVDMVSVLLLLNELLGLLSMSFIPFPQNQRLTPSPIFSAPTHANTPKTQNPSTQPTRKKEDDGGPSIPPQIVELIRLVHDRLHRPGPCVDQPHQEHQRHERPEPDDDHLWPAPRREAVVDVYPPHAGHPFFLSSFQGTLKGLSPLEMEENQSETRKKEAVRRC